MKFTKSFIKGFRVVSQAVLQFLTPTAITYYTTRQALKSNADHTFVNVMFYIANLWPKLKGYRKDSSIFWIQN